ncbi:hypothetical protein FISHEDRAFT_32837 [Fistulina hepatica ATCC 64428]|uniref:Uncharacterized protein n=1 Tax=Fistulina hepatica ATCC 64428 TaxID=1128425 RepID=A0A0D7APH6_9AGAR|nr:hypothetical protein FISHEDRAFT_32837 [Fistulina hepatica ATCC 64428]
MYLMYIPEDMVDDLASQLKVKTSAFYTGTDETVAQQLAQQVDSGFDILSVSDPNTGSSSSDSSTPSSDSSASETRENAIIGVVSALGGLAVIVLGFLIYRALARRRELAHRRLSDQAEATVGARPEGREFDEDSVGGQRRRSFYYAEDSLRGFESYVAQGGQVSFDPNTQVAQRRRPIMPAAISAPILRESSMNW